MLDATMFHHAIMRQVNQDLEFNNVQNKILQRKDLQPPTAMGLEKSTSQAQQTSIQETPIPQKTKFKLNDFAFVPIFCFCRW